MPAPSLDEDYNSALTQLLTSNQQNKQLHAVHTALTETIRESSNKIDANSTFLAALVAVEGCLTQLPDYDNNSPVMPLMQLLECSVKYSSSNILASKCSLMSRVCKGLLHNGQTALAKAVTRLTASILVKLLPNSVSKAAVVLLDNCLLALFNDARPKVRKSSQEQTLTVLHEAKCESQGDVSRSIISHVGEYIHIVLSKNGAGAVEGDVLHLLAFVESALPVLPLMIQDELVADLLQLMYSTKNEMVMGKCMKSLNTLLEHESSQSEELAPKILATLLQKPSPSTSQKDYLRLLTSACAGSSGDIQAKLLPLVCDKCLLLLTAETAASVSSELLRLIRSSQSVSDPTNVLKILSKALDVRYRDTWVYSLPALGGLTVYLCNNSSVDCKEMTQALFTGIVKLHEGLKISNQQQALSGVTAAVTSIAEGLGVEFVCTCCDVLVHRWILELLVNTAKAQTSSILQSSTPPTTVHHPPSLQYFTSSILNAARAADASTANAKLTTIEQSQAHETVVALWSLFPAFCVSPTDLSSDSLGKLMPTLLNAAKDNVRYPELCGIVCSGLRVLCLCVEPLNTAMSDGVQKLLPAFFRMVDATTLTDSEKELQMAGNRTQALIDAIAALARLAPTQTLQSLFKKLMQKLLSSPNVSSKEDEAKVSNLLHLALALVTSEALDNQSITLLYRALKPVVRSDETTAHVQKRAYKILCVIFEKYTAVIVNSTANLEDCLSLLTDSIMSCHVSARYMRLKCLKSIVGSFDNSTATHMQKIPQLMGEVLLCLKDANGKTREAAYQLLLVMAEVRGDIQDFAQIILAAFGAQTAHMRSAAVLGLSRVVFERARTDDELQEILPQLLQTVLVLFNDSQREVAKSVVGYVRISVAAMTPDQLEPLLPDLVAGLMADQKCQGRFRNKIKIILKILGRRYGYDRIKAMVPEADSRLITHIRKLAERAARKKAKNIQESATRVGEFDEMVESDEEDSDDGRTLMTGFTGFTKMTALSGKTLRTAAIEKSTKDKSVKSKMSAVKSMNTTMTSGPRIVAEREGEVLDMLDERMTKSVRFAEDDPDSDFDDDDDDVMEFDAKGRLIVKEANEANDQQQGGLEEYDEDEMRENAELKAGGAKRQRISKFAAAKEAKQKEVNKKNKSKIKVKDLGAAFKSKKAGGDVKRKDQRFEPYAFVPLDGKSYTKKNRDRAVAEMSTVVRNPHRPGGGGGGKRKRR